MGELSLGGSSFLYTTSLAPGRDPRGLSFAPASGGIVGMKLEGKGLQNQKQKNIPIEPPTGPAGFPALRAGPLAGVGSHDPFRCLPACQTDIA